MYLRPSELSRPRIIVLDEDPATMKQLSGFLSSKGYAVIGADTAAAAWDLLRIARLDLVIASAVFPEREGAAWRVLLEDRHVNVPVIAMCARCVDNDIALFDAANALGAAAVLQKPFNAASLQGLVEELLPQRAGRKPWGRLRDTARDRAAFAQWSLAVH